jgi:hypothetical protein
MQGKERLRAPGRVRALIMRFSAWHEETPGLKPIHKIDSFSAGLKSSSPLLKQGASTIMLRQHFRSP